MDQKFGLTSSFSVRVLISIAPPLVFHQVLVNALPKLVDLLEILRERDDGVSVCKYKLAIVLLNFPDGCHQMQNCALVGRTINLALVNRVEHRTSSREIKRDVVVEHAFGSARHRPVSTAILNALIGNARHVEIGQSVTTYQPTLVDDRRQVLPETV